MSKLGKSKNKSNSKATTNGHSGSTWSSCMVFIKSNRFRKIRGVFYILLSLFLFVIFVSYLFHWKEDETLVLGSDSDIPIQNIGGTIGANLGHFFIRNLFGITSFGLVFLLFIYGFRLLSVKILPFWKTFWMTTFWIIWGAIFLGYLNSFFNNSGFQMLAGSFGIYVSEGFNNLTGKVGTALLAIFTMILYLVFAHNLHFKMPKFDFPKRKEKGVNAKKNKEVVPIDSITDDKDHDALYEEEDLTEDEREQALHIEVKPKKESILDEEFEIDDQYTKKERGEVGFEVNAPVPLSQKPPEDFQEENAEEDSDCEEKEMRHYGIDEPYDPRKDLSDFKSPSVDMLINYELKNVEVTHEELIANKNKIVETLKNYSIDIVKIVASPGPTVTLYEIVPAPGIRISKIKNLEDDIALSLSALGIRIIAPIPGKGTIGIEVPNAHPQIVSMRTMLTSEKFLSNKFELPIAIGKTISNEPYVADLAKMPHLLMAGATGQGKSVGLNAIIASLLYKKHPAELKFIMVDPKKVELSLYNKIERHYLAKLPDSEEAIITDTRKVVRTLNSLCIEMDNRYDLLKTAQVKNIKEYNPKFISRRLNPEQGHRYLPYIVVVVDEFADLIMTAGKEVELPIARIAQLARAVGIHLIIATQRPSVNIITGTIKANFPARIAFRVTSKIDSRTILDTGGADQLIGRGDMLLSSGSEIVRLQCALIDTEEIEQVAEYIGSQRGYSECFLLPEYLDEDAEPSKEFDPKQKDDYFEEAARLVVASQHGSTSLLQRKLQLGYNRAGRIIDQLEAAGIVGPFEGSKARDVLIKTEVELIEHLRNINS